MKTGLFSKIHNVVQRRLSATRSNTLSNSPKGYKTCGRSRQRIEFLAQSTWWRTPLFVLFALIVSGAQIGCDSAKTSQTISIDGSSTVYPLSGAIAKAFGKANPAVQFKIEFSGTGGGFKKFCTGQLDIADASRPINSSESEQCKAQHIEYIELPVAFDSLSVVVNAKNTFVECLSVKELRSMWGPAAEGKVRTWQQIRPSFPAKPLALFSLGKDSGTFDYFTLAIVGTEGQSRGDVVRSEDDLVIERGVAADPNALGYFGYAYYQANSDKVKLVAVDNGHGCVAPSFQTVADTTYQPLSRPLFIYVNVAAAARPDIKAFTHFYLSPESAQYVTQVGYVPLPAASLAVQTTRFDSGVKGSALGGHGSVLGVHMDSFSVDEEEKIKAQLVQ
jgi:phosphate transport system substrate-binding protein